ncbi:hypothetical protein WICMUC_005454 [Wickerhamomyces mucosus]|uniref:Uncharacterized protein n=1 Tax=Wickerhamomyces mucosus TaxID=1378264 RepID=A0A9P8P970_9ASCO|nr:hypothetical protein WICMUC_005454 [Wickerhamomyces mucosus]
MGLVSKWATDDSLQKAATAQDNQAKLHQDPKPKVDVIKKGEVLKSKWASSDPDSNQLKPQLETREKFRDDISPSKLTSRQFTREINSSRNARISENGSDRDRVANSDDRIQQNKNAQNFASRLGISLNDKHVKPNRLGQHIKQDSRHSHNNGNSGPRQQHRQSNNINNDNKHKDLEWEDHHSENERSNGKSKSLLDREEPTDLARQFASRLGINIESRHTTRNRSHQNSKHPNSENTKSDINRKQTTKVVDKEEKYQHSLEGQLSTADQEKLFDDLLNNNKDWADFDDEDDSF